ncbi:uncharacterized protein LOC142139444 isoform X2 [Mixophyes fleayi]|uniref:uncharacterized protein LOC142139444 isoform X2 n=1 Tax=Mixophyes fleayi TaxID=3061075 RepID=UPI003F4DF347
MGLSKWEREGCRQILMLLTTADLFSLVVTVTKKTTMVHTSEEAIYVILQHSQSATELLNRRKVYRDTIYQYLNNEGVCLQKNNTKSDLMQKAIKHWREQDISSILKPFRSNNPSPRALIPQQQKVSNVDSSCPLSIHISQLSINCPHKADKTVTPQTLGSQCYKVNSFQSSACPPRSFPAGESSIYISSETGKAAKQKTKSFPVSDCYKVNSFQSSACPPRSFPAGENSIYISSETGKAAKQKTKSFPVSDCFSVNSFQSSACPPRSFPAGESSIYISSETGKAAPQKTKSFPVSELYQLPTRRDSAPLHVSGEATEVKQTELNISYKVKEEMISPIWPVDFEMFGKEFCQWFYPLLNAQNPSPRQENGDWGPQHFFGNAVLQLHFRAEEPKIECIGAESASSCLLDLTQKERLSFYPSFNNRGVKCVNSPEGLVLVTVAGTVHRDEAYIGTFDQIFKLGASSSNTKWKIAHVDLSILSKMT